MPDGTVIRPYGDTTGDGMVQTSFTLPVPPGPKADGAALQLATKMGIEPAMVVHSHGIGEGYTFFVVYGSVKHLVDLEAVLEIERQSFRTPWSRQAFLHELERNRVAGLWVARGERSRDEAAAVPVLGYLCLWAVADEVHVTNLAVHPARRGEGVGRRLLGTLLAHHRSRGARRAFLEVRPGNAEARRLYEGLGFKDVTREMLKGVGHSACAPQVWERIDGVSAKR